MKIALVHDWFNQAGGAEKVVREMLYCFPEADVFCLFDFFDDEKRAHYLFGKKTKTSFIQHLPFARKLYRLYFPLFPLAIERLSFRGYDLVISSSSCVAKGIIKDASQMHISYCHSPARYAWDMKDDYLKVARTFIDRQLLRFFFNRLRRWDMKSSHRVDHFIANSEFVRDRIERYFGRDATVIYPPVDTEMKISGARRGEAYVTLSRIVLYKNLSLLVEAFRRMPGLKLVIAGDGPMRKQLMRNAPSNVTFTGYVDEDTKHDLISGAKAFVAAAVEDFGITIVEAQSYGTPVIVPMVGGYRETVNEKTGVFFHERTADQMVSVISEFEKENRKFEPEDFRNNISRFGINRFHHEFRNYINGKVAGRASG